MIEVLMSPGMKTKGVTTSYNCSFRDVTRHYANKKKLTVTRPFKDGWYPLNVITPNIYAPQGTTKEEEQ